MVDWPAQTHLCSSSKEDMAECYRWLDDEMPDTYKLVIEDWATLAITWNFMFSRVTIRLQSVDGDGL